MEKFQSLRDSGVSRRALFIAPFAFAGLLAFSKRRPSAIPDSRANGSGSEITLVIFTDNGRRESTIQVRKTAMTDEEWRKKLTPEEFAVTRRKGTERAFTGEYWNNHDPGIYRCVCCGNALFNAEQKFDSGTGWPSFWAPIAPENVHVEKDTSLFMERSEVLCAKCDAHLGHVFDDGPAPTHLRYCMNSAALRLVKPT